MRSLCCLVAMDACGLGMYSDMYSNGLKSVDKAAFKLLSRLEVM